MGWLFFYESEKQFLFVQMVPTEQRFEPISESPPAQLLAPSCAVPEGQRHLLLAVVVVMVVLSLGLLTAAPST